MNFFYSIQFRLFALCAAMMVILVGTNLYLSGIIRDGRVMEATAEEQRLRVSLYNGVRASLDDFHATQSDLSLASAARDAGWIRRAEAALEAQRRTLTVRLSELELYDARTAITLRETLGGMPERSAQANDALRAGRMAEAQPLMAEVAMRLTAVDEVLSAVHDRERALEDAARMSARSAAQRGADLAFYAIFPATLMALLLGLGIVRSIIQPLQITVAAIRKVNAGDNDVVLPPVTRNEFGDMAQALHQLRDHSERLHTLAYNDTLTGLSNRARMEEALNGAIADCRRSNQSLALLFIDLDNFKVVNESFGHDAGDRYLVEAAQRLKKLTPSGAVLCRYSGDKFTLILAGFAKESNLKDVVNAHAERVRKGMGEPLELDGRSLNMAVSMGIAIYPQDGAKGEQLLSNADSAMYLAKRSGRNNVQFSTRELADSARRRVTLASEIRRALSTEEFRPHFQPVVDTLSRRVVGAEALMRWYHPSRGLVSPSEFIPVAEDHGFITPLGERSLRLACEQLRDWHLKGFTMWMSVNLSPRQLHEPGMLERVDAIVRASGVQPGCIEFELTESAMMERPEQSRILLTELKSRGHKLSIDDFGTGFSSLAQLQRFPIDKIKIDRSFIMRLDGSSKTEAIVTATISMASGMGMSLVAEGIETEAQMTRMRELGCARQQGYYFAPPLAGPDAEAWMRKYLAENPTEAMIT